ncbi:MAG TPA: glycosyltransferase family 4 protein [Gemmataceae bacterium]|nr:glycosyltransferase family 4 protein [Gemmataceae bacterium]
MKKSVLCVASYFPPDASTGTHRTRAVARYLPASGWRPVVVSPEMPVGTEQDPSLLQGLPEDLVIYRTPAPSLVSWGSRLRNWFRGLFRRRGVATQSTAVRPASPESHGSARGWVDWASWWLQVPDMTVGWLPYGFSAARRAVRRHHCQAIYSSAPQFTTHLIALLTKRATGLPWVADFRDPWRSSPFRKIPYRSADRYDAWLERRVVGTADWVVCNTHAVQDDFARRYPELVHKFVTVPNGFDPEDFADLKPQRPVGTEKLVLTHAGWFYDKRRPHPIFQALRLLRDRASLSSAVCLQLVGHPRHEGKDLRAIAAEYGVEDLVLVRGEVPHQQALELMRGSDVQVLVGFNGVGADLQVPAKLFEYLGVGQPVLALAPRRSAIAEMLGRSGADGEVCDPEDPEEIASAITRLVRRRNGSPAGARAAGGGPITQFYRREQVSRIAGLLTGTPSGRETATQDKSR